MEAIRKLNKEHLVKYANATLKTIRLQWPMRTATLSDHRYIMTLIEDYSGFTAVYCLKLCIESKTVLLHCIRSLGSTKTERNCTSIFSKPYTTTKCCSRKEEQIFGRNGEGYALTDAKLSEHFWGEPTTYEFLDPKHGLTSQNKAHKVDQHGKRIVECQAKGAIERSREYEDTPKLLKKEDNVNMVDVYWPQQQEPLDEGEPIKNT
ncbi:hypothetical protein T4B_7834 [Trichinella pseudospiralis]|nr:hypothetical protein T4B_7834 [Trichinella pseudospiralis]